MKTHGEKYDHHMWNLVIDGTVQKEISAIIELSTKTEKVGKTLIQNISSLC